MIEELNRWGADFLELSVQIALGMFLAALFLTVFRLIRGPHLADRIMSLDLMTVLGIGFIGLFAITNRIYAYLDVAIAVGLVGFLATAAFARFLSTRRGVKETPHD